MQALPDAAALSTSSQPDFHSPLGHTCSDIVTPHEADPAWEIRPEDISSWCLYNPTEGVVESLRRDEPSDNNSFAGVAETPWGFGQHFSSHPPVNPEFFDEPCPDTRFLNASLPELSLRHDETPTWLFDTEQYDQSVSGNLTMLQPYHHGRISPVWTEFGSEKEIPMSSFSLTSPLAPAEPVNPTSQLPLRPIHPQEEQRLNLTSTRGGRSMSRSHASESLKRRIDPLKNTKTAPRERSDSFPCNLCDRTFRYKKDVERHKTSVHDKNPSWFCPDLECKFATQGFSRKDKAFQHVRTHRSSSDGGILPIHTAEKLDSGLVLSSSSGEERRHHASSVVYEEHGDHCMPARETGMEFRD